jgi:hypothetical protein
VGFILLCDDWCETGS